MSGSYRNSQRLTVKAMDFRFGMNGKLSGFEVGGFNALQAKAHLNAAADGDGGTTRWIWVGGVIALITVLIVVGDSCDNEKIGC